MPMLGVHKAMKLKLDPATSALPLRRVSLKFTLLRLFDLLGNFVTAKVNAISDPFAQNSTDHLRPSLMSTISICTAAPSKRRIH
ncbi:hypothetical protein IMCC3135_01110 [Granulosicoccus antarcticus IMCC3135]|uniref:Uncharacterized protein n=1 Tax=Granulosicoccus antarcticus IMCC3135 TaxID=1192854 RepID=A0A2Z2NTA2_9GAMM|nr:hypothetical protein IMCC3135_01110 [Granulosicoccus antarcticus IMCC3135]